MKTNCKKWKYLLYITAVMTAFASIPFNTQAADLQVRMMDVTDKKQEATSDKMNSADNRNTLAVTAGAADILDSKVINAGIPDADAPKAANTNNSRTNVSTKSEALTAFTKSLMV
ncbi:MAG: hypothetical protein K2H91_14595, partial [Lachnospiraceae bacterium]|nr:hypothetical protein [Lachnospiraceae bacterium]